MSVITRIAVLLRTDENSALDVMTSKPVRLESCHQLLNSITVDLAYLSDLKLYSR